MNRLKAKRIELGYTQKELAKKIDMSFSTYVLKENGKTEFKMREISKILKVLNCKYEDIF